MPDASRSNTPQYGINVPSTRNQVQGNDYFSQMMNRFNGR
jgi:hypothetical protein